MIYFIPQIIPPSNSYQLKHIMSLQIIQLNCTHLFQFIGVVCRPPGGYGLVWNDFLQFHQSHCNLWQPYFQKQIQSAMLCWLLLAYGDTHSELDFIGPPTFRSFRVIPFTSVKQAMNLLVLGGKRSVCRPFSMATDKYWWEERPSELPSRSRYLSWSFWRKKEVFYLFSVNLVTSDWPRLRATTLVWLPKGALKVNIHYPPPLTQTWKRTSLPAKSKLLL